MRRLEEQEVWGAAPVVSQKVAPDKVVCHAACLRTPRAKPPLQVKQTLYDLGHGGCNYGDTASVGRSCLVA